MQGCCFLEGCGFFARYKDVADVVTQGWIRMYCADEKHSEKCKRKEYRQINGTPPPASMTPTGKVL